MREVVRLAPGFSVKALVVDDVQANRDILQHMLADIGVEVALADDGLTALKALEQQLPDIVFMDISMPNMDGQQAMQRIRHNPAWRGVKIVAVSASVLDHQRQEYLAAGFDDFIDKPFIFPQICTSMAHALEVEFEYEDEQLKVAEALPADWNGLSISTQLHSKLHEAAEIYSVTEMEDYFKQMEALGDDHRKLAAHLRDLTQQHNMDAVLAVLEELPHE